MIINRGSKWKKQVFVFFIETVQFNQKNTVRLGRGKKISEKLDEVYKEMINEDLIKDI